MKSDYLIKIAPLIRLPFLKTQVFSYLSENPIPTGSLVIAPFYRRNIQGIVISSKKDFPRSGGMVLKRIGAVIQENIIFNWQIDFAVKLAGHYLLPLGTFLNLMVPKESSKLPPEARLAKGGKAQSSKLMKDYSRLKVFDSETSKKIIASKKKKILVVGSADVRRDLNTSLISKMLNQEKQCLVIVPEIYGSFELHRYFQEIFPDEEVALFHGKISKNQCFSQWEKVKQGDINIIISTKLGVFLPFSQLGLIILLEEQDISHKQWNMNPRYSAREASQYLAEIHSAKILLESSSPATETYWKAKEENWLIFDLEKKQSNETEIVDLFQEKKNPDFPISKILYQSISQALNEKKKVLLVAKRRGYSTLSVCRSCKSILKCPDCDRAIPYFEESESYRCLHCSFATDLFTVCPKCGSHQFSHLGIGSQLVERKLKRLFPSAKIARLDADSVKTVGKYEIFRESLDSGEVDIVVGTQIGLALGGFFHFKLVGIVSAHDFLNIPDFNSSELVLSQFVQARNLVEKDGKFILQTYSPRDSMMNFLTSKEYRDFFKTEISLRKKLSYPPFSRMIKLSYRDQERKKVEKETQKTFDLLIATGNNDIEVADPYEPIAMKKRGFYYKNILIKIKSKKEFRELPIWAILGGLRKGWTVDVDPISTA